MPVPLHKITGQNCLRAYICYATYSKILEVNFFIAGSPRTRVKRIPMAASPSSAQHSQARDVSGARGFLLRGAILIVVVAIFMSIGNVNIGAIGQGLGYALAGVTVYLTYRVLGFVDLTVDGAFPIGGAVCAVLIVSGQSPEVAIIAAFVAGALTGLATALIDIIFRIEGLLASIIVITGAYTVTLHIMGGRSNVPLLGEETIISRLSKEWRARLIEQFGDSMRRQSTNLLEILLFAVIVIIVLALLYWFLRTEIGLAIRASGKNPQMVRATGLNHNLMIAIALMVANGLAGIAGSLVVQQFGFADVSLGFRLDCSWLGGGDHRRGAAASAQRRSNADCGRRRHVDIRYITRLDLQRPGFANDRYPVCQRAGRIGSAGHAARLRSLENISTEAQRIGGLCSRLTTCP